MSHKSRIRRPLNGEQQNKHAQMVSAGLQKMAPFLKTNSSLSANDMLIQKVMHVHKEVAASMLPIVQAANASGLVDHTAAREMFARLYLERFDKFTKDELVTTLSMLVTEEAMNRF